MLKVTGESMIEAGILHGDYVVIRTQPTAEDGDIVVALLNGETTLKRFFKEDGKIRLKAENSAMSDIIVDNVRIIGIAVGLLRSGI